jgi:hypothetical protein
MMRCKSLSYCIFTINPLGEYAYSLDCTFFRLICLTAKALHRMAMCGFLVGTTEPEKSTLKRVQLRVPG